MYKKKYGIVTMRTDKSLLVQHLSTKKYGMSNDGSKFEKTFHQQPLHMHVVEIEWSGKRIGDWVTDGSDIFRVEKIHMPIINKRWQTIIASTDPIVSPSVKSISYEDINFWIEAGTPITVELEMEYKYVEPDSSIHCNRGDDVLMPRLSHDGSSVIFVNDELYSSPMTPFEWQLSNGYAAPTTISEAKNMQENYFKYIKESK